MMSHRQETTPSPVPAQFSNPVSDGYLADPQCFYHRGAYYALGTGDAESGEEKLPGRVIPMMRSHDLQRWESAGHLLEPPPEEKGGSFWAPEVHFDGGTFYLYYHANGGGLGFRIRVATSKNPEGPYTDTGKPMTDIARNSFAIDSTAFRDDDGRWYLFYATDFYDSDAATFRGTALVMDRLNTMTELAGHPQTVMRAHWPWQLYLHDRLMGGVRADWYTLEGPAVVKRDGRYYCFYSGGNFANDTYGVDYLVADRITGPWREAGAEILRTVPGEVIGPGHNSIVSSPDGKTDYIVYHAWNKPMTRRQMWVDPLTWTDRGPQVERFVGRIQECNRQAEEARRAAVPTG